MAGYLGTKAVLLSTTAADVVGNAEIGGDLTVGGAFTSQGIDDNASATAMTLDASGNVGIGTSSPTGLLTLDGGGDSYIALTHSTAMAAGIAVQNRSNGQEGVIAYNSSPSGERWEFFLNSTERMRIDASGRVTMPYQPAFFATGSAGFHTTASGGVIPLAAVPLNVGNHYNTSGSKFTAPVSGSYQINLLAYMENTAQIVLKKNGADYIPTGGDTGFVLFTNSSTSQSASASGVVYLNAGDYIQMGARVNQTVTLYTGHSHFSGYLIG